jgi:hypothetical protein
VIDPPWQDGRTVGRIAGMTHPVRIGLQLQPQHADYAQIRRTAAAAEEAGVAVLDAHCADIGRDPGQIKRSIGVRRAPEEVADALVAAGATLFTVGVGGPDHDLGLLKDWIAWRDARTS